MYVSSWALVRTEKRTTNLFLSVNKKPNYYHALLQIVSIFEMIIPRRGVFVCDVIEMNEWVLIITWKKISVVHSDRPEHTYLKSSALLSSLYSLL